MPPKPYCVSVSNSGLELLGVHLGVPRMGWIRRSAPDTGTQKKRPSRGVGPAILSSGGVYSLNYQKSPMIVKHFFERPISGIREYFQSDKGAFRLLRQSRHFVELLSMWMDSICTTER